MVYLSLDDMRKKAKKILDLLALYSFAQLNKEPNKTTKKAIEEARSGKTKKAESLAQLFSDLAL